MVLVVLVVLPLAPSRFPPGSDRPSFVLNYFLFWISISWVYFWGIFGPRFRHLYYVCPNSIPSFHRLPSFLSYIIIYICIDMSLFYFFSRLFSHRTYTGYASRPRRLSFV